MICHSFSAFALWYLDYPDQGLARNQESLTLAQQSVHPFSLSFVLSWTAQFHQYRREVRFTQEHAEPAISLATDPGFPMWVTVSAMLRGWALVHQGQAKEGIAQITQGLMTCRTIGSELARPYFLALLAEAYGIPGKPEAGLAVLTEALMLVDTTGERWYEPELHRLKGELLLQQNSANQAEAENCFHHAIAIARTNKPNPSNPVLLRASGASGSSKGSATKPMTSLHQSTGGSPRDLTHLICRMRRRC